MKYYLYPCDPSWDPAEPPGHLYVEDATIVDTPGTSSLSRGVSARTLRLLVPDDEMSPDWVAREVPALLGDPARLAQMAANAAVGGHRDAATRVACAALELAEGHRGGR